MTKATKMKISFIGAGSASFCPLTTGIYSSAIGLTVWSGTMPGDYRNPIDMINEMCERQKAVLSERFW